MLSSSSQNPAAATREQCACVWAQACVTNLLFSRAGHSFCSTFYSCMANGMKNYMKKPSHLQDSTVNSSTRITAVQGTRHISESSFGLSGGLQEKPELSRLQDWGCQLVTEPGQWVLCQPCSWPQLAGLTWQPFPICDIQATEEKWTFCWQ